MLHNMTTLNDEYEAAVKIESLVELENNPRRGDMDMLNDSVDSIGFYGACIVNRETREVLVGNHRMRAAREQGMDTVPVIWVDVDEVKAKKIALIDNHANDRATYDVHDLLLSIEALDGDFAGTGYTETDYADLLAHTTAPTLEELEGSLGSDDEDAALTVKMSLEVTAAVRNRWEGFRSAFSSDDDALAHLLDNAGVEDDV